MHSDLIGKVAKARRYAQEPERVLLVELQAQFHGGNHNHTPSLHHGHWNCTCSSFHARTTCPHVMALQQLLTPMLPAPALTQDDVADGQTHMHSEMIGKVAKARRYAQEPERVEINGLRARFQGGNNEHQLALRDGVWACSCDFFQTHSTCSHVMALEEILKPMLPVAAGEVGS